MLTGATDVIRALANKQELKKVDLNGEHACTLWVNCLLLWGGEMELVALAQLLEINIGL